jgi:hypothetical protein
MQLKRYTVTVCIAKTDRNLTYISTYDSVIYALSSVQINFNFRQQSPVPILRQKTTVVSRYTSALEYVQLGIRPVWTRKILPGIRPLFGKRLAC